MQLVTVKVVAMLVLLGLTESTQLDSNQCPICPNTYKPICAEMDEPKWGVRCTFTNQCYLERRLCLRKREVWRFVIRGRCHKNSIECGRVMDQIKTY